jgi:hypothetical protein
MHNGRSLTSFPLNYYNGSTDSKDVSRFLNPYNCAVLNTIIPYYNLCDESKPGDGMSRDAVRRASARALPSDTFINTCNHLASIVPNLSLH